MFFYDPSAKNNRQPLFELQVNGREVENDEDERNTPTDYTADPATDSGADSGPDNATAGEDAAGEGTADPVSQPEDYTVPGGEDQSRGDQGGDQEVPPEEGGDNAPPEGEAEEAEGEPEPAGEDEGGGAEVAEGEGAPEDYTNDTNQDADEIGPDNGTSDDGSEGSEMEGEGMDSESPWDREIHDLEDQINNGLSGEQLAIRDQELKRNYNELYDSIQAVIDRINDLPKDVEMIKPIEFVSDQLAKLSDRLSDYIVYTYTIKTSTENAINYEMFMHTLKQINDILGSLAKDRHDKNVEAIEVSKRDNTDEFGFR